MPEWSSLASASMIVIASWQVPVVSSLADRQKTKPSNLHDSHVLGNIPLSITIEPETSLVAPPSATA